MKKIILTNIYTNKECLDELKSNFNFEIFRVKNVYTFGLLKKIIPWISMKDAYSIHQSKSFKPLFLLPNFSEIKRILFGKYDCWISKNIYSLKTLLAFLVTKLRRKKIGIIVKEFHWRKENFLIKISCFFVKHLISRSDYFIAYSLKSKQFLENEVKILPKKIYYIPKNRKDYRKIDFDKNKLEEVKKKFFSQEKVNILFLGRIVPFKGLDILLLSLKSFRRKVRLVIVGEDSGVYAQKCKKIAKDNSIDAVFVGKVGDKKGSKEVVYFYKNADLFVLPNKYCPKQLEAVEIWGSVVDEAMYFSLPAIVASATGCSKDLVESKDSGRVIRQGSIKELQKAIKDYLNNPGEWRKSAQKSPVVVEEKNKKNCLGWFKLFRDINRKE